MPGDPETCPQCGRPYLRRDTGRVSFGDAPGAARGYCSRTPAFSNVKELEVYWHSAEQLAQESSGEGAGGPAGQKGGPC